MPPEGHDKIEQLLREHTERRRTEAGAPLELHPATRRLLLGEVARLFPRLEGRRPWHHFKTRLWPRFSFGFTTLAIFALVGWAVVRFWNELPGVGDVAVREAQLPTMAGGTGGGKNSGASAPVSMAKNVPRDDDGVFELTADGLRPVTGAAKPAPLDALAAQAGEGVKNPAAKSGDQPLADLAMARKVGKDGDSAGANVTLGFTGPAAPPSVSIAARGAAAGGPASPGTPVVAGNLASAQNNPAGQVPTVSYGNGAARLDDAASPAPVLKAKVESKLEAVAVSTSPVAGAYYFAAVSELRDQQAVAPDRFFKGPALKTAEADAKDARDISVLSSFELRRDAANIRIIDADGSAYEGQIVGKGDVLVLAESFQKSTDTSVVRQELHKEMPKAGVAPGAPATVPQNWSFRASGTNRTLNQLVTVTGSMSGFNDESGERLVRRMRSGDAEAAVTVRPLPVLVAPATPPPATRGPSGVNEPATQQIQGKVRVGNGPERELKALRVIR